MPRSPATHERHRQPKEGYFRIYKGFGIGHGACIDRRQIEEIVGYRFGKVKKSYLRPHCRCMESVDIGHYPTCDNGRLSCYAMPERPAKPTDASSPSLDPADDLRTITLKQIRMMHVQSLRSPQRNFSEDKSGPENEYKILNPNEK